MTNAWNVTEDEYKIAIERSRDDKTSAEDSAAYWQLCRFYRGQIFLRDQAAHALHLIRSSAVQPPYQTRVNDWMLACFGAEIARDKVERNHRFLEEALELVQSLGCTMLEAYQLVDYVFGREIGEPPQEVGGVEVTLAALCLANDLDKQACGETELARVWTKIEKIRAKQAAKPKHSPLPEVAK